MIVLDNDDMIYRDYNPMKDDAFINGEGKRFTIKSKHKMIEVTEPPSREEIFKAMSDGWIESQSWEQGAEGPAATDRGSYKHGFLSGVEWMKKRMEG